MGCSHVAASRLGGAAPGRVRVVASTGMARSDPMLAAKILDCRVWLRIGSKPIGEGYGQSVPLVRRRLMARCACLCH